MTKEAASGVDGVTFQEYEKHLEAKLVERLKRKSYHARLVRRKYIPIGNGKLSVGWRSWPRCAVPPSVESR
jgi:retron-type reverse transcriptase